MYKKYICRGDDSPWGEVQWSDDLYPGIFQVSTAGHGGLMIEKDTARSILSAQARKEGFYEKGFYCFEEDTAVAAPLSELVEQGIYHPKLREGCTIEDFKRSIGKTLKEYHPEYYQFKRGSFEQTEQMKFDLSR